jgi:hypothetical protein
MTLPSDLTRAAMALGLVLSIGFVAYRGLVGGAAKEPSSGNAEAVHTSPNGEAAHPLPPPSPGAGRTPVVPAAAPARFDQQALTDALDAAGSKARRCAPPNGEKGKGRLTVTIAPDGHVSEATLTGPGFDGTALGVCVRDAFREVSVPPFPGNSPVTFSREFVIK